MKNLNEMTEFDKRWKDTFDDAEMAPSEGVWDKIDAALSKEEAGYFKKRAFLFKLMAAASIIFALGVSIISINYYLKQDSNQIVSNDNSEEIRSMELTESSTDSEMNNENSSQEYSDEELPQKEGDGGQDEFVAQIAVPEVEDEKEVSVLLHQNEVQKSDVNPISIVNSDTRDFYELNELMAHGIGANDGEEMYLEIDHIYLIPIMPRGASSKKREVDGGGFLAGLDFSTGVFDPNFQQGSSVFASTAGATYADARVESVNDQLTSFNATNKDFLLVRSAGRETKPEVAYSYGANFGFKVSRRIILQTGIAYRKANTTTTTTGYFEDASSNSHIPIVASHQYQLDGLSAVKRTAETDLSNQYEFASIPLRAGYIIVDRKVNLSLMAGISSELFLNNEIGSNNNEFETLSSSRGEGSPYKNIYFNGSLGTMLGYTFAKNYLITVEPSYRFAMNSFTRDDFYLNSYPSSFMVSFGVAYNFK